MKKQLAVLWCALNIIPVSVDATPDDLRLIDVMHTIERLIGTNVCIHTWKELDADRQKIRHALERVGK